METAVMSLIGLAAGFYLGRWHGGGFWPAAPRAFKSFTWAALLALPVIDASWWWLGAVLAVTWLAKQGGHGAYQDMGQTDLDRIAKARALADAGTKPPFTYPSWWRPKMLLRRLLNLPGPSQRDALDPTGKQREPLEWVGAFQEETVGFFLRLAFFDGTICGRRAPYEALAMAATGALVTFPLSVWLAGQGDGWGAMAMLLAGLAKGPIYWGCWRLDLRLPKWRWLEGPTAWAEGLTGAAVFGALLSGWAHGILSA